MAKLSAWEKAVLASRIVFTGITEGTIMRHIQYSTKPNPVTVSDWTFNESGQITIDGAIIDPQFMASAPVRLACKDAAESARVIEAIEQASMPNRH